MINAYQPQERTALFKPSQTIVDDYWESLPSQNTKQSLRFIWTDGLSRSYSNAIQVPYRAWHQPKRSRRPVLHALVRLLVWMWNCSHTSKIPCWMLARPLHRFTYIKDKAPLWCNHWTNRRWSACVQKHQNSKECQSVMPSLLSNLGGFHHGQKWFEMLPLLHFSQTGKALHSTQTSNWWSLPDSASSMLVPERRQRMKHDKLCATVQ